VIEVGPARPEDMNWLEEHAHCAMTRFARGIAAWRDGETIGCVGYDLWTENSVTCHMAVTEPIAWRRLIPLVFEEPFKTRGVLLGVIAERNIRSRTLAHRFGFREVARVVGGIRVGEALIVHELRRENCHFLED
jgi:RimJ/RimL family protein N-acetyltransferase